MSIAVNPDSLLRLLEQAKNDTSKILLLNNLSELSLRSGDFNKALGFANQSKQLAGSLRDALPGSTKYSRSLDKLYSEAYNHAGNAFFTQHLYSEALENFKLANKLAKESRDNMQIAATLSNMGKTFNEEGDFPNAASCFNGALDIYRLLNDKPGIADSYNNLGNMAVYQSNYPEAMKNFLLSLKLREETNDKKGIAACYNNLGNVATYMENYQEALKNYKISLPLKLSLDDNKGVANLYNAIGSVYGQLDQSENALENFKKALEIQKRAGNKNSMAQLYNNMGVIHTSDGNYSLALDNFTASMQIKQELNDKKGVANTLSNIAGNFLSQKDYPNALKNYIRSLEIAKEMSSLETIKQNYLGLSETYSATGNFEKAYDYHLLYTAVKDSVLNSEKNRLITEMKTQFETEKKDDKIKLLSTEKMLQEATIEKQRAKSNYMIAGFSLVAFFSVISFFLYNQKRKTAFDRQVSQVEMTALRAQMNPHFIFNSLNSIYKYIQMKEPDQASHYLVKFSKLMRLILENSRFQEVPLEKDLHALELYMELEALRLNNRFTYEISTDLEIDKEITLVPPLILQPFVENSIWHGLQHKTGDGKISIHIAREGNMLACTVADNGVGRKKATALKAAGSTHKGESLGMKITNARIDIINKIKKTRASVRLTDLEEGVQVEVRLPLELSF